MNTLTFYHRSLIIALGLLVCLYVNWFLITPPIGKKPNITVFILQCLPIVIAFFLVLRKNYRGFIWVCFMSLFLFCVATANMFSSYSALVYSEMALMTAVFLCSMCAAMQYGKK